MVKIALILCAAFVAISSAYSLPQPNSPKNIDRLNNLGPNDLAEELSGQFEGDMVLSPEEIEELLSERGGRTGLIDERFRWTDNIVPYYVNRSHFTTAQYNYITLGVQRIMDATCIKLVPYDENVHTNYVYITGENSGCWSFVGMRGNRQQLNLQPFDPEVGCFRLYTIVHEFIHALGFYHMQSATERDHYVRIIWENIQSGTEGNFNKYEADRISQYGVEYDYGSVMHYSATAFSVNGEDTIVPTRDLQGETMGQRLRMSDKDIARLNNKYCSNPRERITVSQLFRRMNTAMNNLFSTIFN
jgi:hypothetical protein